jgi:putative ABC transport system ATP-binding protein
MHRLHEERGVTFPFSTHDRMVMTRAERLILLRDGRVVADGRPGQILDAG